MKPAFTFTAVALAWLGLAPLAQADYWATLAGATDSITLKTGETALIMSVDNACVIQYTRRNARPVQMQLGGDVYQNANRYHPYHRSRPAAQVIRQQFPMVLTGPAKISVQTTNVVSLKVVQTQIQKAEAATSEPPAKAALWQSLAKR